MRLIRIVLVLALAFGLSACASKFKKYNGPAVTEIQVQKSARRMYLLHDTTVLKAYDIALGQVPTGPKQVEGDARTPEGLYYIDHRNPNSKYHLSLGISYPNEQDKLFASTVGMRPGGEIFIHGFNGKGPNNGDWTYGCIAVTNNEMEDVYAMVRDGTPINILP
jgi:murein L,D-transpeptidase YafK